MTFLHPQLLWLLLLLPALLIIYIVCRLLLEKKKRKHSLFSIFLILDLPRLHLRHVLCVLPLFT